MAGLWRVDFKVSNWLGGTRVLSAEERGIYIDIIMLIYEHGGPIADVPEDLCRILNIRYRAKLESLLAGLERRDKIWRRDGHIGNKTCDLVLARARGDDVNEAGSSPARKAGKAKSAPAINGPARGAHADRPANDAERPGASPGVGRASGAEIQSNQGPEPPPSIANSYIENPPDRPSALPRASVPDSVCRTLIDAFDDALAVEWGPMMRRPMPAGKDWPVARGWAEQGADARLVAEVASREFAEMHKRNFMPRMLSVLSPRMQAALAERKQLQDAPRFDPERRRWTSHMECWLRGQWLDAWGPEPGKRGCDMPQHLQAEILAKRNKVA